MTSRKDQEQYWAREDERYRFVTVKEFADAFQSFHVGQKLSDHLSTPFDKSKNHPAALTTKDYGVKTKEFLKACISREYLLMHRNSFVYIFKLVQVGFSSLGFSFGFFCCCCCCSCWVFFTCYFFFPVYEFLILCFLVSSFR